MLKNRVFLGFWLVFLALLCWDLHAGLRDLYLHFFHVLPLGTDSEILLEIKLPRILLALLAGAILSGSGAIMQNIFHNPLIDPYLLGVSAGASLGCGISFGLFGGKGLFFFALSGALGTSFLILLFARFLRDSAISLVLVGVIKRISKRYHGLNQICKIFERFRDLFGFSRRDFKRISKRYHGLNQIFHHP